MKIRIKRVDLGFFLLFAGLFLFSYYVKKLIIGNALEGINILSIVGTAYLIYLGIKNKSVHISCKIFCSLVLISLTAIFVFVQTLYSSKSFVGSAKYFFGIIYPIIILYLKIDDQSFARIFRMFLRCLDIAIGIMFIMLIIDLFTNNAAIKWFANAIDDSFLQICANSKLRHASIVGHYIPTAEMYCIFYIMHAIDMNNKKTSSIKNMILMLISLVGVGFSGSKAAIFVLLISILVFNAKKIQYFVAGILTIILAYFSGVFDIVFLRLTNTELTTGRVDMLIYLGERYDLFPAIGHGANSSYSLNSIINWASAAFEFPPLMFSYEYGVIFMVIFYLAVFIVPLIILLKKKNYINFAFLLLLDVIANTYNGISLGGDYLTIYIVAAFFIINADKIKLASLENRRKKTIKSANNVQ